MAKEKPNNKIENFLREYKEFCFFLSGLLLGYILHAIA